MNYICLSVATGAKTSVASSILS